MPVKDSDLYDENNDSCTPKKYNNASNTNDARNKRQVAIYGDELSPLEWLFIEKYLLTFNQTQSYLSAYSEINNKPTTSQNANKESNRLLKDKRIQGGIKLFRKEIVNKININREQFVFWVVEFMNKVQREGQDKLTLDTIKYLGTILGFSTPHNFHVNNKFLVNVGGFNPDEQLKKITNYPELTIDSLNEKLKLLDIQDVTPITDQDDLQINDDFIIEDSNE